MPVINQEEITAQVRQWIHSHTPRAAMRLNTDAIRAAALTAALPEDYESGLTISDLAQALGCSEMSVNNCLHYQRNHASDYGWVIICRPWMYGMGWLYYKTRDPDEIARYGRRLTNVAQTLAATAMGAVAVGIANDPTGSHSVHAVDGIASRIVGATHMESQEVAAS